MQLQVFKQELYHREFQINCEASWHFFLKLNFFQIKGQMRPPGFPTRLLLSNRCWDSVSIFLKLYDLCVPARQNDQAHYMHAPYERTLAEPERAAFFSVVQEKSEKTASAAPFKLISICSSQLVFGLLSEGQRSPVERLVQGTSYDITDLIPGSDYRVSVRSVLGSDASRAAHRVFSTRERHLYTTEPPRQRMMPENIIFHLKSGCNLCRAGGFRPPAFSRRDLVFLLRELGRRSRPVRLPQSHCNKRLRYRHPHRTRGGAGCRGDWTGGGLRLSRERCQSERSDSRKCRLSKGQHR